VINVDRMRSSALKKVRQRLDVPRPQNQVGEWANRVPESGPRCSDQDSAPKPLARFLKCEADFTENGYFHDAREFRVTGNMKLAPGVACLGNPDPVGTKVYAPSGFRRMKNPAGVLASHRRFSRAGSRLTA
jgi:hypothetical protein